MSGKLLARLYPAHRAFHRASPMGTRKAGVSTFPDFAGHDSRVPIVVPLTGLRADTNPGGCATAQHRSRIAVFGGEVAHDGLEAQNH